MSAKKNSPAGKFAAIDSVRQEAGLKGNAEGFTLGEYMDRYKLSYFQANRELRTLIDAGKMCRGKAIGENRRSINVYWVP